MSTEFRIPYKDNLIDCELFCSGLKKIVRKGDFEADITDFAIILGGSSKNNIGQYWTNTRVGDSIMAVDSDGKFVKSDASAYNIGYRPCFNIFSRYNTIKMQNKTLLSTGGISFLYGEYPQNAAPEFKQVALEELYSKGALSFTGKEYTINDVDLLLGFQPKKIKEYEADGRKYVRLKSPRKILRDTFKLSNHILYHKDDYIWVEVKPIRWFVDDISGFGISSRILFAGIPHQNSLGSKVSNGFDVIKYMETYFSKEILPQTANIIEENNNVNNIDEVTEEPKVKQKKNVYGFDFSKLTPEEVIKCSIESGIPVFLHGRSSEGKSARVKQIDPDCTIIYLRNATPESLNGKSVYNSEKGEMIDVKPSWLVKLEEKCAKEPDKLHILFFDEITNALPSIQGIAFNIVLDKEVNGKWTLPSNVRIVAAGNEIEDSLAANKLAEPLFNRFAHVYIETTADKWLEWASENNIHPAIYAYIALKKDSVLRTSYDGKMPNADPRKWEMASKALYATGKTDVLKSLVGEEITREFVAFCSQSVFTLESVLNGDYTEEELNMNISEKYATVIGLTNVDEENFVTVREFVSKLGSELVALFDSMWARGKEERLEMIAEAKLANQK